jgi:LPS-assembly protein
VTRPPTLAILAVLALAAAQLARGQSTGAGRQKRQAAPSDSNAPPGAGATKGTKGTKVLPPVDPDAPPPGEMRVRAESYEQVEKGHTQARGFVDLRLPSMRIQADRADVYEEDQPDGTKKRRVVAEGNVVFLRGEERLAGDRMEMEDSGHGFLTNAIGYVEPGVFVEGRLIERIDDRTYRVEDGRFSSCSQPNPRWKFASSSAKIEVDDKIIAKNALFEVKGVPAFYLPYFYYPIRKDGRATGFLLPHFGYSSYRGFSVGGGFFWATGRSWDQTFYADSYSKLGYGFGYELRFLETAPSRGDFRTYVFDAKDQPKLDYDINWNALQMLPGRVRASLQVRRYSDLLFQERFQDNFNIATNRTERWALSLEKDLKLAVLSAYTDSTSTYFGTDYRRVNGHLPGVSLRRFPRQIGWGGVVVGLQATADSLQYGTQDRVDRYARIDVAPTLSRPVSLSFLDVTPQVAYRYTRYGASYAVDEEGTSGLSGPPLDRQYFETTLDVRGPTFSRVFDTPGLGYSDRLKHTIGPEITWTYRTRVEDFNAIPKFDGDDYSLGTNQITYALAQRFFAKRQSRLGLKKKVPYEFFTWRLMQTYYVQISEGQNNFDPNYSSSAFGPGLKPEHLSPLMSRIRFRPTPDFWTDFSVEYDVNFKQVRRTSISQTWNTSRLKLTGGWSRSVRLSEDPTQRTVGAEALRGGAAFEILPTHFFVEGSADYDVVQKTLWQARAQARYMVQCCGFEVEYITFNWNARQDTQWRFNIQLANIGSIGNFLGANAGGGLAGSSYR